MHDVPSDVKLCYGCQLRASYGKNKLIVKYPALLRRLYPDAVINATLHGRLLFVEAIINVNPSLVHDSNVSLHLHC